MEFRCSALGYRRPRRPSSGPSGIRARCASDLERPSGDWSFAGAAREGRGFARAAPKGAEDMLQRVDNCSDLNTFRPMC
jgi:hypothetical protein